MFWLIKMLVISFLITVIIEAGAGWCWKIRGKSEYLVILLVNLITNPPFVFATAAVSPFLGREAVQFLQFPAEAVIWLLEGFIYKRYLKGCSHPYLFSFVANGLSFGTGMLLNMIR